VGYDKKYQESSKGNEKLIERLYVPMAKLAGK